MAILHGVGVGPGDPELLTLKAIRLILEADVVFCPKGVDGPGRARRAAQAHLGRRRVVELEMEMRGNRDRALLAAARAVVEAMAGGVGVYLTEGDPSLFSTFRLLVGALEAIGADVEIRVVPGVSSVTAAAAAANLPLGLGDQAVALLPASAPLPFIEDVVETFDQTVLLKPSLGGRVLAEALDRLDRLQRSVVVTEATGANQTVQQGPDLASGVVPYFATWIVPGGPPASAAGAVHFVGAGPGSPDHLTARARRLLRWAELVVVADSLVAPEVAALARPQARILRTSDLTLEESVPPMIDAARAGQVVVRLHSGDPSIYGAVAEQMALLRQAGCRYEVVPGVSSPFAVAAALGLELTCPGGPQTVIFTRHGSRVPTPAAERLRDLAAHRCTLAIFLSAAVADEVQAELEAAGLDPETPVVIAHRVAWPDEQVVRTTIALLAAEVRRLGLRRHTLILVGESLTEGDRRSRLYDSAHAHVHRRRSGTSAPALSTPPALVALTAPGVRLARRLQRSLPEASLVIPERWLMPGEDPLGSAARTIPRLFEEGRPLVLFMAVGAAVRLLAGALGAKSTDPPVVTVDDAGRHVISLLGGRAAGANRLAAWVAGVLGAEAVVTTAADVLDLPALDEALTELGWQLSSGQTLAHIEAAVLNGESIGFYGPGLDAPAGFPFKRVRTFAGACRLRTGLVVSDKVCPQIPEGWAVVRPRRLVLGVGCSTQTSPDDALAALDRLLHDSDWAADGFGAVATIDRRADHPALLAVAARLGVDIIALPAERLRIEAVPNPSEPVRRAVGTPSVAEAAARAVSGGGRLLQAKLVRGHVVLAIAERPGPMAAGEVGD